MALRDAAMTAGPTAGPLSSHVWVAPPGTAAQSSIFSPPIRADGSILIRPPNPAKVVVNAGSASANINRSFPSLATTGQPVVRNGSAVIARQPLQARSSISYTPAVASPTGPSSFPFAATPAQGPSGVRLSSTPTRSYSSGVTIRRQPFANGAGWASPACGFSTSSIVGQSQRGIVSRVQTPLGVTTPLLSHSAPVMYPIRGPTPPRGVAVSRVFSQPISAASASVPIVTSTSSTCIPPRPSARVAEASKASSDPVPVPTRGGPHELVLMTLNLQYFSSYPEDEEAAASKLAEATSLPHRPDVICVQEGLGCKDVISPIGYRKVVCSAEKAKAQSVRDMVYSDPPTLKICKEAYHDEMLCNQIYVRNDSEWQVCDQDALVITSDLHLAGGGGRAEGKLAIRSMVWVKLQFARDTQPVYVMCTHITGGRFEDQYFTQQLMEERYNQLDRILTWFENDRPDKRDVDVGILLGDFNATMEYLSDGAMHGYFKASIGSSAGVKEDIARLGLSDDEEQIEDQFQRYMISPFDAINSHDWKMVYKEEDRRIKGDAQEIDATDPDNPDKMRKERLGSILRPSMNDDLKMMRLRISSLMSNIQHEVSSPTSGFGHVIDHMAYYDATNSLEAKSAEVKFLTNQKFSKEKHTDLPITDHNSVKVVFTLG